jgi:hypothetical protein
MKRLGALARTAAVSTLQPTGVVVVGRRFGSGGAEQPPVQSADVPGGALCFGVVGHVGEPPDNDLNVQLQNKVANGVPKNNTPRHEEQGQ